MVTDVSTAFAEGIIRVKTHLTAEVIIRVKTHLTLVMTSAQVFETSVTTTDNSPSQDYTHQIIVLHFHMLPPGSNHLQ